MQNGIQIKKLQLKSSINIILSFLLLDIQRRALTGYGTTLCSKWVMMNPKHSLDQLVHKLWEREKMSRSLSFFIPGLHTQFQFNDLTHSGLSNQLKFMQATGKFHEKMRLYFYPKIFANEPVNNLNWDSFQPEHYQEDFQPNWWAMLGPLFIFSLLLGILTMQNFRKPIL